MAEEKIKIEVSKKKVKIALYFFIPLFFMVLGALSLWYYQSRIWPYQNKKTVETSLPPAPSTSAPTKKKSNQTIPSGWQEFNSSFGFSLYHPSDWHVEEGQNHVQLKNFDPETAPPREYIPELDKDLFKIEIYVINDPTDIDDWFTELKTKPDPMTDDIPQYFNVKKMTIDGQKAIFYECLASMSGTITGHTLIQTPNNKLIDLWGLLSYENNKSSYNQILSTFKFID